MQGLAFDWRWFIPSTYSMYVSNAESVGPGSRSATRQRKQETENGFKGLQRVLFVVLESMKLVPLPPNLPING